MNIITRRNAALFLLFNSFLWGSSYIWSKMLLQYLPRFSILCISSLGSFIATGAIFHKHLFKVNFKSVKPMAIASCFSILSNTFCMLALEYTSSSNTAFIVQTSVILTPVLMAVIAGKLPEKHIMMGSLTALAGIFLLTCDFATLRFNPGDLFALGNALFFSMTLITIKLNSDKVDSVYFTLVHHLFNASGFFVLAFILERQDIKVQNLKTPVFALLILANTAVSCLTILFQSTALKYVRADTASLIYTLEPVAASVIAFALLGERMNGIMAFAGCLLILFSVVFTIGRPVVGKKLLYRIQESVKAYREKRALDTTL